MDIKTLLCSVMCITSVVGFTLPYEGLFKLDIIHYNDFHARFEETSIQTPTCRFNNNSCLGGFPRLYHEIDVLFKEKPQALLLNAGDSFQGTYWYTLLKWNVTQKFMNLLPHDAHALGNHEFDDGPAGLLPYLQGLKAPVVAANMDSSRFPALLGLFEPYVVVKRDGRKIGIIGLITTETATLSSPGKVQFTDPGEAMSREAKKLKDLGVDIIIVLSHCGIEEDKVLAREYGENIDIIVGGHSHTLLWNSNRAPSGETVEGSYPTFVESNTRRNNHQVLIVQTSAFTKYMGNLTVYFDYKGDLVKWEGNAIFLNRSIEEDEDIKQKLEPYAALVHESENKVVGETETDLFYQDCVYGECALGDLIVDGMLDYAKRNEPSDQTYFSFIQRGNIRSTIASGNITRGEIFELLPYKDKIDIIDLQGKFVIDALERSVIEAWAVDPFKGPWVLQVAGLKVVYNISQPEGSRITSLAVVDEDGSTSELDPEEIYKVVVPNYLGDGGDGFDMFKKRTDSITIGRDSDILEEYIKDKSPINISTSGRITINS